MNNQQIEMLEKVASVLAQIPETFVFTGGATIALYVDEVVRADLRPTDDVDCVVEITTKGQYYQLAQKLRELGLEESLEPNTPLCRWQYQGLNLDIMPCAESVLGFSNLWYSDGIKYAISYQLPSNRVIKIFSPESDLQTAESKVRKFVQQWFQSELDSLQEVAPAFLSPVARNSGRTQLLQQLLKRFSIMS